MNKHNFFPSVIVLFLITAFSLSYSDNIRKGKVKVLENIPNVLNPKTPIHSSPLLILEKVWETGGENPGFFFNNVQDIKLDKSGGIYVVDIIESDVKVFSSSGEYLLSFGKAGQGPGEFESPRCLCYLPDQQLMVIDQAYLNRFSFFHPDGKFIHSRHEKVNPNRSENNYTNERDYILSAERITFCDNFSQNRLILFTESVEKMMIDVYSIWLYDFVNETADKITFRKKLNMFKSQEKIINDRMSLKMQWCHDHKGNIYILEDIYEYSIQIYDTLGHVKRTIKRDFKLPLKTKKEYDSELKRKKDDIDHYNKLSGKKFKWKELKEKSIIYNPFIITRSMFCDKRNYLWVLTNEPVKSSKAKNLSTRFSFDIFDPDGKYLMKIPFDAEQPRCFIYKDEYLYYAALKKDSFPWLFKYRIVVKEK